MEVSGRRRSPPAGVFGWLRVFVMWMVIMVIHGGSVCLAEDTPIRNISWMEGRAPSSPSSHKIKLEKTDDHHVVMDNGILQVTLSIPDGNVEGIKFNGIDNVLAVTNKMNDRGYWDVVWNNPGEPIHVDRLTCSEYRIIAEEENQVEVSFTKKWSVSDKGSGGNAPLNVDKRFIMTLGDSGFYTYAIFERPKGWPDVEMDQIRTVYKLEQNKFRFMSISDRYQRVMPSQEDREKGMKLAYPEAVLLTDSRDPKLRGEVDDKYQYSQDKTTKVHGWICNDPPVGFWMITPSDEFRNAGPTKQDLTSHVGPTTLSMFVSTHYAGKDLGMKFSNGEPWKKVFGPVFVYLNSIAPGARQHDLWVDATRQMNEEVSKWPYSFPKSDDYARSDQRGGVDGQLSVNDKYINKELMRASSAYVGLAAPGEAGSWQRDSKGYQFWTRADKEGRFSISNVLPGDYNLYAWIPSTIGDYKYNVTITITPGQRIKLSNLMYYPPRSGPTLWEIGVPDRSAGEFFVPDPYPNRLNRLFVNRPSDKFRQYGLWQRYADLYPKNDLVFRVGVDNYARDWFFAQVTRNAGNSTYKPTTWQIIFELKNVPRIGTYTLRLALASAHESDLEVRVNNPDARNPSFSTGMIGKDNAIARHGIHGIYWLFSVNVDSSELVNGSNTIFLRQAKSYTPFEGIMYDYIRFEGPANM